jgi:hypothetical protein
MITREQYWAALDSLQKARVLEAQKAAAGPEALAAWWQVAAARWRELHAVLDQAEHQDWARASVWERRHARARTPVAPRCPIAAPEGDQPRYAPD